MRYLANDATAANLQPLKSTKNAFIHHLSPARTTVAPEKPEKR